MLVVVVAGPPGSGKTTLAKALAEALALPVVSRDEIKEGYVYGRALPAPSSGDAATVHATRTFFETVDLLISRGVSLVADAAFREDVWRPHLEQWSALASVRIFVCVVDPTIARDRIARRAERAAARRRAHADAAALRDDGIPVDPFFPNFPHLTIDTTDGLRPPMDDVLAYIAT